MARIELPDFVKMREDPRDMTPEQMRSMMKKEGIVPPRQWDERPIVVTCSADIADPFQPDAPPKSIRKRVKDTAMKVYMRPVSKIVKYLPDFDRKYFAENDAVNIYRKAHELLAKLGTGEDRKVDEEDLLQYVTEKCYPEMLFRVNRKTIHWKWLGNLEKPQFVSAQIREGAGSVSLISPLTHFLILLLCHSQGMVFGQVTVRLHSQQVHDSRSRPFFFCTNCHLLFQILAVYDRFGRLLSGSENVVKDVLEYVVYENFLTNSLGQWRIHGKILPESGQLCETQQTFRIDNN